MYNVFSFFHFTWIPGHTAVPCLVSYLCKVHWNLYLGTLCASATLVLFCCCTCFFCVFCSTHGQFPRRHHCCWLSGSRLCHRWPHCIYCLQVCHRFVIFHQTHWCCHWIIMHFIYTPFKQLHVFIVSSLVL